VLLYRGKDTTHDLTQSNSTTPPTHPIPAVLSPPPPNLTCKPKSTSQAHKPSFPTNSTPDPSRRPPPSHLAWGPASGREAAPDGGDPVPHTHAPAGSPTPSPNGAPFREGRGTSSARELGSVPSLLRKVLGPAEGGWETQVCVDPCRSRVLARARLRCGKSGCAALQLVSQPTTRDAAEGRKEGGRAR
jgi:hypothetical protein